MAPVLGQNVCERKRIVETETETENSLPFY